MIYISTHSVKPKSTSYQNQNIMRKLQTINSHKLGAEILGKILPNQIQ